MVHMVQALHKLLFCIFHGLTFLEDGGGGGGLPMAINNVLYIITAEKKLHLHLRHTVADASMQSELQ